MRPAVPLVPALLAGCSLIGLYDEPPCREGQSWCREEEECIDLSSNPESCGSCGTLCNPDQYCEDSTCTCRPELHLCDGACLDLASDPEHCGDCDTRCTDDTPLCEDGACTAACQSRTECPGLGACVDTQSDPLHCGGCGSSDACAQDQVCLAGECLDYLPAWGCDICSACGSCVPVAEECCDLLGYGSVCVDISVSGPACPGP